MVVEHPHMPRMSAAEARDHRVEVEDIFRASYVEAIDSGEEFESPAAFMHRFDAYTDPSRSSGFQLVIARIDGLAVGQTWGWPLGPRSQWWNGLRLDGGDLAAFTAEDGTRTFALSEIMVRAAFTGRGIARALHDDLLGRRPEQRATLLVSRSTPDYVVLAQTTSAKDTIALTRSEIRRLSRRAADRAFQGQRLADRIGPSIAREAQQIFREVE